MAKEIYFYRVKENKTKTNVERNQNESQNVKMDVERDDRRTSYEKIV